MILDATRRTWLSHWRAVAHDPALLVWCLFVLLSPIYVFKSGLPQPGDLLVFLLVPLALARWDGKLDRQSARMIKPLLWFTLWVCVVNYGWAAVLWKWTSRKDFVTHPFFYAFNVAVFLSALVIARRDRDRFVRITVDVVYLTIIVTVIASVFMRGVYRTQVFFNSPNQLGYYALLAACLFALAQRPLQLARLKASIGVAACAYLALLSGSRASLAGILMLLVVLLFSNPKIIIAGVIAAAGIVTLGGPIANVIEFNEKRALEDRYPHTSFAEERGYDRIWRNPEYLITGAGEGAYERFVFRAGESRRELHSSFGSVVFGYGIIGVSLFMVFFVRAIRGAPLRMILMLLPTLIYTVAHHGLRFTTFWVVLAAYIILKSTPDVDSQPHGTRVPART
jgi:hypothetical protein